MNKENLILNFYKIGVIKFGKFTLKSGKISPYYFNLRSLCSYPRVLKKVAKAYAQILSKLKFDALAGVPYAGIPLATAVSLLIGKRMIFTRKEVKEHGLGKMIIGDFKPKEKVVMIDDVITDGKSKLEAITPLKEAGLKVKDIIVIIDRGQGGPEIMKKNGYKCYSLLDIYDVIAILEKHKKITPEQIKEAKAFISS